MEDSERPDWLQLRVNDTEVSDDSLASLEARSAELQKLYAAIGQMPPQLRKDARAYQAVYEASKEGSLAKISSLASLDFTTFLDTCGFTEDTKIACFKQWLRGHGHESLSKQS